MSENFEAQKNQLIHDLRAVVHDAQALAQSKSRECNANSDELKSTLSEKLNRAMNQLHHMEFHSSEKIRDAAQKTEAYVQSHPMRTLGISAGIGLLLGLLIKRR